MKKELSRKFSDSLRAIYRKLDLARDELLQFSPKELAILFTIEECGPLRVKDLSDKLSLPSSTVSWTVDKMVAQGALNRKQDPNDRRAIMVSLAHKGEKALLKHQEIFDSVAATVIENLPEGQAEAAAQIIEKAALFFK